MGHLYLFEKSRHFFCQKSAMLYMKLKTTLCLQMLQLTWIDSYHRMTLISIVLVVILYWNNKEA